MRRFHPNEPTGEFWNDATAEVSARAERAEAALERVRALAAGEKHKAAIITESATPLDGDLAHQWQAVAHVCGQILAVLDGDGARCG